jgi:hypothetical protein
MSTINMKWKHRRLMKFGLKTGILFICLITSLNGMAQSVIEDPMDGDGLVPLDGGVTILLAAAAGLGAYRTAQRRK